MARVQFLLCLLLTIGALGEAAAGGAGPVAHPPDVRTDPNLLRLHGLLDEAKELAASIIGCVPNCDLPVLQ